MIQELKQAIPVNVLPGAKKSITPDDFISMLRIICEDRHRRYTAFHEPVKNLAEKLNYIEIIRTELKIASLERKFSDKLKTCLKTENFFKRLAPRTTAEAWNNYNDKINACMNACREAIGWRAQGL